MLETVKRKLIQLVEESNDEGLLTQVYSVLESHSETKDIFDDLTEKDKAETMLSLNESKEAYNLIDHEEAMETIRNNLGWS
jgi:uncharacterized protein YjgD (DUF1641 family)